MNTENSNELNQQALKILKHITSSYIFPPQSEWDGFMYAKYHIICAKLSGNGQDLNKSTDEYNYFKAELKLDKADNAPDFIQKVDSAIKTRNRINMGLYVPALAR